METYRNCPNCKAIITYSDKYKLSRAHANSSWCKKCRNTGRTISELHRKRLSKSRKISWNGQSENEKALAREILKNGREKRKSYENVAAIWKSKGLDVDKKKEIWRKKLSLANTGENNPMFGRPSPSGSGNGWKGWLDGRYCRSLREAFCIIERLNGVDFESGESKKYRIKYINPLGMAANYYPDFVTNKEIIECKPKRLWKTPLVKAKAKAGWKFAKTIGKVYKLVDVPINADKLKNIIETGRWIFQEKYQIKYDTISSSRNSGLR